MECRIVVTRGQLASEVGVYDPGTGKYSPLGTHRNADIDRVVRELKLSTERAGHKFSCIERSHDA